MSGNRDSGRVAVGEYSNFSEASHSLGGREHDGGAEQGNGSRYQDQIEALPAASISRHRASLVVGIVRRKN